MAWCRRGAAARRTRPMSDGGAARWPPASSQKQRAVHAVVDVTARTVASSPQPNRPQMGSMLAFVRAATERVGPASLLREDHMTPPPRWIDCTADAVVSGLVLNFLSDRRGRRSA